MLFGIQLTYAQSNHKQIPNRTKSFSAIENKIIDTIMKLPEVEKREQYVRKQTNGKRHLQFSILDKPTKEKPYYWVTVMEDNGVTYYTHFNFFVYPKTFLIKYLDNVNGKVVDLKTWRKSKDNDL